MVMPTSLMITGAHGMLGRTLLQRFGASTPASFGHDQLDISDGVAVEHAISAVKPSVVINCAALTAVDRCESERAAAMAINARGPDNLARACARIGAKLVQISTDYVFGGDLDRPYDERDVTAPRTVYGTSKLAGERAVQAACDNHLIIRTAWLYGPGGPSFFHAMVNAAARGADLKVVDDQVGNPTTTEALAEAIVQLLAANRRGVFHCSCEGEATWFRFAEAIFAELGIQPKLRPCSSAEFPRPAPRPANSRLEKRALREQGLPAMPDWRDALAAFVKEHRDG
jgi:dTDP-4-dehydrorhamnose reductase